MEQKEFPVACFLDSLFDYVSFAPPFMFLLELQGRWTFLPHVASARGSRRSSPLHADASFSPPSSSPPLCWLGSDLQTTSSFVLS